jgi:hypothetical protein
MSQGLQGIVDNNAESIRNINLLSNDTNILMSTLNNLPKESFYNVLTIKYVRPKTNLTRRDLAISLVAQGCEGFIGLALVSTPYVISSRDSYNVNDSLNEDFECKKIPQTYTASGFFSRQQFMNTPKSDILDINSYIINPNHEGDMENFYTYFKENLIDTRFCTEKSALHYAVAVADAVRTQKIVNLKDDDVIKFYTLLIDNKPSSLDYKKTICNGSLEKESKCIYILKTI